MRNRLAVLATVSAALFVLSACGSLPSEPGGGSSDGPAAGPEQPVSSSPGDGGKVAPGKAQRVYPQPAAGNPVPSYLHDFKVVDDDTLDLFYYGGVAPCSVLDRVDVDYLDAKVMVTLFQGSLPQEEQTACIEIAVYKRVRIDLDEPLDGRRIVDGSQRLTR